MKDREIERKYEITEQEFVRLFETIPMVPGSVLDFEAEGTDFFFLRPGANYIWRYRRDIHGMGELTVKSYGGDTLDRMEVNLTTESLDPLSVIKFMSTLGLSFAGSVDKEAKIVKFARGDVSVYKAVSGQSKKYFLEIEAHTRNEEDALDYITDMEIKLGLHPEDSVNKPLYDIMVGGQ